MANQLDNFGNLYIGVDGGGSKTLVVVIDENERIIGESFTGPTNFNSVGAVIAKENLHQAFTEALGNPTNRQRVVSVCLGLSGVNKEEDLRLAKQWVIEYFPLSSDRRLFSLPSIPPAVVAIPFEVPTPMIPLTEREKQGTTLEEFLSLPLSLSLDAIPTPPITFEPILRVSNSANISPAQHLPLFYLCNDAVIALCSGTKGILHGIVQISGTGSITLGLNAEKKLMKRVSGWGSLFGDEGSGTDIGKRILKAFTAAVDGRGPPTVLVDLILKQLELKEPTDLLNWANCGTSPKQVASLAPLLFTAYQQGDSVAIKIVSDLVTLLASDIHTVANDLQFDNPFTVVLAGGIHSNPQSLIGPLLKKRLEAEFPNATCVFPQAEPALVAAQLAKQKYHEEFKDSLPAY